MASSAVSELIERVRDMLDEVNPGQWTDKQIRRWINAGLRDMGRVTRHLRDTVTVTLIAGTSEYTVADNVLEITQAYYIVADGSNRYTPLVCRNFEGMDSVWGDAQLSAGNPLIYTTWGFAPNLRLRVYPVPVTNANVQTIKLMVIRTPAAIALDGSGDSTAVDFPETWTDALEAYAVYKAFVKDGDPRWQQQFQVYAEIRDQMVVMGDYLDVNRDIIMDPFSGYGGVPAWLSGFD